MSALSKKTITKISKNIIPTISAIIIAAVSLPVLAQDIGKIEDKNDPAITEVKDTELDKPARTGEPKKSSSNRSTAAFSLGLSGHYQWWNPIWGKTSQVGDMLVYALLYQSIPFLKFEAASRVYEVDPAFMGGINFNARFQKGWGLSADLTIGGYRDASVMVTATTTNPASLSEYTKYRIDSIVFDSTVLVHYRLAPWVSLSLGPVYQGYTMKEKNSSYLFSFSNSQTVHHMGGSVGGTFSVRLVDQLYFKPEISFLALYGIVAGGSNTEPSLALGGTVEVPFSYYLEKIRITITLGVRYQFLYYMEVYNTDHINRWDHRYAVMESVTYNF